jgi:CheY-like chemotaxis protein
MRERNYGSNVGENGAGVRQMKQKILIIDDEEHIRRMMRLALESAGYEVGEARNGFEGVRRYGDGWDCVVLDQRMAGMDGLEALREIRKMDRNAIVVMATAYASIELAVDAMKIGASDFVRKPLTPDTLRNAIAAAIAKRHATGENRLLATSTKRSLIETVTMNGFTILDSDKDEWQPPEQRRFLVLDPTGLSHEVVVKIEEEVLRYVERMTRKALPPESSFWTSQARRLLSDYLWEKGEVPAMKFLTLNGISRDDLAVAETWGVEKAQSSRS